MRNYMSLAAKDRKQNSVVDRLMQLGGGLTRSIFIYYFDECGLLLCLTEACSNSTTNPYQSCMQTRTPYQLDVLQSADLNMLP